MVQALVQWKQEQLWQNISVFLEARLPLFQVHLLILCSKVTSDDVILCSGCSCALDIAISTLADDGQNILVPRPGFPLYTTLSAGLGIQTREYDLLPDHDWMVDLGHMESLIDHNTAAIIVNSPSNPCGSVFSPAHLRQILDIAERHKVPIIGESTLPSFQSGILFLRSTGIDCFHATADEIYDNFVFPGETYVPIASLTTTVPTFCFPSIIKPLSRCLSSLVGVSPKGSWCQAGEWAGSSSMTEAM